jgi:hypothetical protein
VIDRGTFEQYAVEEVARWLGSDTVIPTADVAVAEAGAPRLR